MRRRRPVVAALPVVGVLLALSAGPAAAQPPGAAAPSGAVPVGRAVGDAGTALGIVRLLPNSAPTRPLAAGAEQKLPRQSAAELGLGLASAQANSEARLVYERSVAQAAPGGVAVQGASPQAPGTLVQTAPPDNTEPVTRGLSLPATQLDPLIEVGVLNGSAHAKWSETLGPCVGTISDASTEVASLTVLPAIPTLPGVTDLTGVLDAPSRDAAADQAIIDGIKRLAGPLDTLGGVLAGTGNATAGGAGSLVSLPNTLSARSTVRLVDLPNSPNKALQSTSTMRVSALKLLAGTPFEISVDVVSQPTLQVTSTGEAKTSTVRYTAPVLRVVQGGKELGRLDAAHPTLDVPIGIPLPGTSVPGAGNLPIIGDLLAGGQRLTDALGKGLRKLDLGVIRLGVAQLNKKSAEMTDPFKGYQLGATARLLDLQVLPTAALGLPNLPSALAQVSLGEQVARAYAPAGGVMCGTPAQPPPPPEPQGMAPPKLAYTNLAYQAVPMFWTGSAMLLLGVVLVAASPVRRPQPASVFATPPDPADGDGAEPDHAGTEKSIEDTTDPATAARNSTEQGSTEQGSAEQGSAEQGTGGQDSSQPDAADRNSVEPDSAESDRTGPNTAERSGAEPDTTDRDDAELDTTDQDGAGQDRADQDSADRDRADQNGADRDSADRDSAEAVVAAPNNAEDSSADERAVGEADVQQGPSTAESSTAESSTEDDAGDGDKTG